MAPSDNLPSTIFEIAALVSRMSKIISSSETLDSISALDFDASAKSELLRAIPYFTNSRDRIADSFSSSGISSNLILEI